MTFFQETLKSLDETENFPTHKQKLQNAIPKLFFVGSRTGLNWFAGLLSECEKMAVFRDGQNNRTRRLAGRKERKRAVITGVAFGLSTRSRSALHYGMKAQKLFFNKIKIKLRQY